MIIRCTIADIRSLALVETAHGYFSPETDNKP